MRHTLFVFSGSSVWTYWCVMSTKHPRGDADEQVVG